MDKELKAKIDEMDYESMLRLWRNAPSGHSMFQGETGEYYAKIMSKKSSEISDAERVAASKNIGWD